MMSMTIYLKRGKGWLRLTVLEVLVHGQPPQLLLGLWQPSTSWWEQVARGLYHGSARREKEGERDREKP